MKEQISDTERKIIAALQKGLPQSRTPYKDVAEQIGISTNELLDTLRQWKQQGKLRRIGAIVNHFKVGLGGGAMVVWQVMPEDTEKIGKILADFKEVSHAYERKVNKLWPYSLYTMVHTQSSEEVEDLVQRMSRACGVSEYRILRTEKELKKVPPTYFAHDEAEDPEE